MPDDECLFVGLELGDDRGARDELGLGPGDLLLERGRARLGS